MPPRLRLYSLPAFEPDLPSSTRKSRGVYYTSPEIAAQVVSWTLAPWLGGDRKAQPIGRLLDPSCGAGEFLIAAYQQLSAVKGAAAARRSLWGFDIDADAVEIARSRVRALDAQFPVEQIVVANTLTTAGLISQSFDAIVGNPPYINIRQLAKSLSQDEIQTLRRKYRTASGNFDLYVLFIERAIELLQSRGRCGLIIPGKWATLDYARPCRELLKKDTTIEQVVDLSDARAFTDANVYPHVLIFEKALAESLHTIGFTADRNNESVSVLQSSLEVDAFQFSLPLDVESRVATMRLGRLASITCGTAGYAADKIAQRLVDWTPNDVEKPSELRDFITSGNIDRYRLEVGDVRYLKRQYVRPKLPLDVPELTEAKRRLFSSPKIVVAGMSRRLEVAFDHTGLALGVQVFALSQWQADAHYLLAILNSKLLSYLFATRYAAKRLGGGYLAVNKGQLANLPIPVAETEIDTYRAEQLSRLARGWTPASDASIDQLVYEIYCLSNPEIDRIEGYFDWMSAKAA